MDGSGNSSRGSPNTVKDDPEKKIKRHGSGIYSRWNKRKERRVYYVQYHWHDATIGKARRVTETVPPDKDGKCRLKSAKQLKAKRDKEKHRSDFVPPHINPEILSSS